MRWLYSGYDWPLYKDWLAWVGLVLTTLITVARLSELGSWFLLTMPITFAIYGWFLATGRNLWRGYREAKPTQR